MTQKEHLDQIAVACREIEYSIKHIKLQCEFLEQYYGIMITDASVLCGLSVHVYAGLELIEKALSKKAVESKGAFDRDNSKRKFKSRGVEWFQLSQPYGIKWREANCNSAALYDLCTGRGKE